MTEDGQRVSPHALHMRLRSKARPRTCGPHRGSLTTGLASSLYIAPKTLHIMQFSVAPLRGETKTNLQPYFDDPSKEESSPFSPTSISVSERWDRTLGLTVHESEKSRRPSRNLKTNLVKINLIIDPSLQTILASLLIAFQHIPKILEAK